MFKIAFLSWQWYKSLQAATFLSQKYARAISMFVQAVNCSDDKPSFQFSIQISYYKRYNFLHLGANLNNKLCKLKIYTINYVIQILTHHLVITSFAEVWKNRGKRIANLTNRDVFRTCKQHRWWNFLQNSVYLNNKDLRKALEILNKMNY